MKRIIWISGLFLFFSCANNDKVPGGIIGKKDMQNILWDMIQADQYSTQFLFKDSAKLSVKTETVNLYAQVFRIHHVSSEEFEKSFQYYLSRPDITKIIFDSLANQANRIRKEMYNKPVPLKKLPQQKKIFPPKQSK